MKENIHFDMALDVYSSYIDLLSWLSEELRIIKTTGLERIKMVVKGKMLPINSRCLDRE